MKNSSPSLIIHSIFGVVIGASMALLSRLEISNVYYYAALSLFGIYYLFAHNHTKHQLSLFFSSLVVALVASVPVYFWQSAPIAHFSTATIFTAITCAYAINAFHIAFYANNRWLNYDGLFHAVWDTFIDLIFALVLLIAGWLLIYLCDGLLSLIHIDIDFIINNTWFIYIISCFVFSIGLFIPFKAKNTVDSIRDILLLICKYLLLALAIISLIFLAAWIIANQSLIKFNTSTQAALITVSILSIIFINGIFQNGEVDAPYPKTLHIIVTAFIITTPIFSLLALYAFLVKSNFVLSNNVVTLINYGLLVLYNLAYAINGIVFHKPWLKGLKKTNIALALVLILISFITNNHWFNSLDIPTTSIKKEVSTSKQKYDTFQSGLLKSGMQWRNVKINSKPNNAILLGYDKYPIYLCRNNLSKAIGYTKNQGACFVIHENKVKKYKNYQILFGNNKNIFWTGEPTSFNNMKKIPFYAGYNGDMLLRVCRTIYKNRLRIGIGKPNGCFIINKSNLIEKSYFYQYLYLLH